jgi:quinoprotein glucose dehydrogenase
MALTGIGDVGGLLAASHDESSAVRMGVLLALRRLHRAEIERFLNDQNPALVLEAARAINDEPINGAMQDLAALIDTAQLNRFLGGEPLLPPAAPTEGRQGLGLEALLRRVLNANFHVGTARSAQALAAFAARPDAPETMRAEALEELADWEHPAGIDRVIGLWRPVAAVRPRETAAEALEPKLTNLLKESPQDVVIAALHAVARLGLNSSSGSLMDLLANSRLSGTLRAEALSTIAQLNLPSLEEALNTARNDTNEELRKTAIQLESKLGTSNAVKRIGAILEKGNIREKQTALATLGTLPGTSADDLLGQWLDRLLTGSIPNELRLDVLEAARKRSTDSINQKLAKYQACLPKDDPLANYKDTMFGGSAANGQKIFFEKEEVQCVRCHRIDGKGGDVGPDLGHVGSQKDRHYLLESIILPNKQIAQGFDSVMLILNDGDSYAGVLKSETPTEIVINTPENGLVTVKKADVRRRKTALSPMPEGLGQILSQQDLRNLVEFLSSLK